MYWAHITIEHTSPHCIPQFPPQLQFIHPQFMTKAHKTK